MPSIPNVKFILKYGNHKIFVKNWNLDVNWSKVTHKNIERKKVKKDVITLIFLIYLSFSVNKRIKIPNNGIKIVNNNKLIFKGNKEFWQGE